MNTGHDNHDGHGHGDREQAARRFAADYPELARELDEAAVGALAIERAADLCRESTRFTVFIAALFALLLLGRSWWEWGAWSLVAVGAVGLLLVAAVIELAVVRASTPPHRRQRPPGPLSGGGRR